MRPALLEFLPVIFIMQKNSNAPRGRSGIHVFKTIPNKEGLCEVYSKIRCRARQKPRLRFAALAIVLIGVRTIVNSIKEPRESLAHFVVNIREIAPREKPSRNLRLIGGDDHAIPFSLCKFGKVPDAILKCELIPPHQIFPTRKRFADNPVTVQKERLVCHFYL